MTKFIFITDTHLTSNCPFRTGDPLQDNLSKLEYIVDVANERGAVILHGGDLFDKSTVPYEVLNKVIEVLKKVKTAFYVVRGNHDQLFRSDENNKKTSLETLIKAGFVKELTSQIDFGDCIVTSDKCITNQPKPQILVYHGFLNTKDGKHTVYADDLAGVTTQTVVLLGHDHEEYEPVNFGAVTVFRPGSLFRNRRVASNDRNPKFLSIQTDDKGRLVVFVEAVPCRPASEIFRETVGKATTDVEGDYMDLISELKGVGTEQVDLMEVVRKVATPEVSDYVENLLETQRVKTVR